MSLQGAIYKYMMQLNDLLQRNATLPASRIAPEVNEALTAHNSLVVTAPPGAGKSTLLPLTLLLGQNTWSEEPGKILMLEPRRLAARQIAERMAQMLGESVGKTVGYRVRFDKKVSDQTRVEVLTEGILTRMLVDDATLEGVSAVVFDEFHERSINSDLALALVRQSQEIIRPDLKIVIMSATIDAGYICQSLGAPLIESEGRMFPVDIRHAMEDLDFRQVAQTAAAAVMKAHREQDGDILVFLPGQGEIERCQQLLGDSLSPTQVMPLYGNLSPEQQRKAIAPSPAGTRKVVLATPIAETSLTIEGVRTVIDSGLCRSLVFDSRTGLSHLETVRISMDMAKQRSGRAGRVAPGTCYRLWTLATEHQMAEQRKPEIEDADLSSLLLDIAAFGENHLEQLPWLTVPPRGNVMMARELLRSLGAIDSEDNITPRGKQMATLPCHPRMARMILNGGSKAQKALACDLAALLEEKDPMDEQAGADIPLRVSFLRAARSNKHWGKWQRVAQVAAEYRRMARVDEDNREVAPDEVGLLLACAYPERIAHSVDAIGNYRLASGVNVQLERTDALSSYSWLAVASMYNHPGGVGRVFLAAPVHPDDLDSSLVILRNNVSWDSKQGYVVMQRERRIGKLVVDSKPIHDADKNEIVNILCEAMKKDGLSMLDWNADDVVRLQHRVAQVAAWHPELKLPDLSTDHLLATAQEWLPFYLEEGGKIKSTVTELRRLPLAEILWNIISYDRQVDIDRLAPTHIQVPTGSRIRVDYRQGAEAPVLSVRLQECFGMATTPCVDDGKRPVLMELLSPGFKPVQLTTDLASFWQGTYFEVRKELRRRYPKHYWPENPLEAEAVRGVKRR